MMKNETPPGAGACCLPNANGLTYLKIGPKGNITGMQNLEAIFQQLYLLELAQSLRQLLRQAGEKNLSN